MLAFSFAHFLFAKQSQLINQNYLLLIFFKTLLCVSVLLGDSSFLAVVPF
ncbi:hypothetical protein LCGC14_2902430 [marine sediment metagenome]|uniref:Uncharacterized protein n=1 Tax=marine sediment metagenome TaxID=412755 RepID=A0A0F8XTY9_9ZZZZ